MLTRVVAETLAKSAIFASRFAIAAYPPLLSISDMRNSLNQTSPRSGFPEFLFFTPTIKVLTNPKFGFPLIPNVNLLSEEPMASSSTKPIPFGS